MKLNLFIKSLLIAFFAFALALMFYRLSDESIFNVFPAEWVKHTTKLKLNYRTFTPSPSSKNVAIIDINVAPADRKNKF